MKLLTTKNAKIVKSKKRGYLTFGMHLLPGRVCARATSGCLKACLNTSGHGAYRNVQEARAKKSKFFQTNLFEFLDMLHLEIGKAVRHAERKGLIPVFRLNLTSDIPWEAYSIPQTWPDLQFYDYTAYHDRHVPDNYHLTFSRKESLHSHLNAKKWLARGGNVAVVFKDKLPSKYLGHKVVSGDDDDLRFLDPQPAIVGLKAKGKAKSDTTGFVVYGN